MTNDRRTLESALLVTRLQRGDEDAFAEIVHLWELPLLYYLRRLAPTEADAWELLQDTWLKAFRGLNSLREPRALPAYLYRIARNEALTRLRRLGVKFETFDEQLVPAHTEDPEESWINAEAVHHALNQLPLAQREALTLFFLQDLSHDDIAEVLGVPVGTVKSRIHYAKQALREKLLQGDCHGR